MKHFIIALLMSAPLQANAQDYSGVWSFGIAPSDDYFTINQVESELIVTRLDVERGRWSAYEGSLVDNKAKLKSIYFYTNECSTFNLEFESDSFARASISVGPCSGSLAASSRTPYAFYFSMFKIF